MKKNEKKLWRKFMELRKEENNYLERGGRRGGMIKKKM